MVLVVKYRRRIFDTEISDFVKRMFVRIGNNYYRDRGLKHKGISQALHFGKSVYDNGWGMFTAIFRV